MKAITRSYAEGAVLLIAYERPSRNIASVFTLCDSGVIIICADTLGANTVTIGLMAPVA